LKALKQIFIGSNFRKVNWHT